MGGNGSIFKRCKGDLCNKRLLDVQNDLKNEQPSIGKTHDNIEDSSGYTYFSEKDLKYLSSKYTIYSSFEIEPPTRWQTSEIIGQGSFGRVLFAVNSNTGELMAVKQIPIIGFLPQSANEKIKEIEVEVEILSKMKHQNIVRYLGTQRNEDFLLIFMEYVAGGSISSLLNKYGKLNETLIRVYAQQILEGLEYLHYNKIIHRDIKGANVLVGNDGVCKLADFGSAKRIINYEEMSHNKSLKGTVNWMAPEVMNQSGHGRYADIWSFGCLMVEMATGKPPWYYKTNHIAVVMHVCRTTDTPQIPEDFSASAVDFIQSCFRRNPTDRPNASKLLNHPFITGSFSPAFTLSSEIFNSTGSKYSTSGPASSRPKTKKKDLEEQKINIEFPRNSLEDLEGLNPEHGIKGPFNGIISAVKDKAGDLLAVNENDFFALNRPSNPGTSG